MPKLYPEDQARVDEVLSKGVYKVDRKPFSLTWLLVALAVLVVVMGLASYVIALIAHAP